MDIQNTHSMVKHVQDLQCWRRFIGTHHGCIKRQLVHSLGVVVCIFCPERFLVGLCRGMSEVYVYRG